MENDKIKKGDLWEVVPSSESLYYINLPQKKGYREIPVNDKWNWFKDGSNPFGQG